MGSLDFSRCRLRPFDHQREDVAWLIERPFALVASEMRTGKTKIVIDATQFLCEAGAIDTVLVVAPAPVRDVWYDPTLGELAKHLWRDLPCSVTEYHARVRVWTNAARPEDVRLRWYVTNYEFLRSKQRLAQALGICGPRTMLVLDESAFVKNHAAAQTKACLQLRRACGRVVLLNGTPIFHSPMDLFSQGNILHPSVLDCKFVTLFKARYAVQVPVLGHGGKKLTNPYGGAIMKIDGWANLDDLQRRFAPYTVRRLQAECLDLPPKLDPVALTATLTPETWRAYREMRDGLVVWLNDNTVATSRTAAVKALRLSQITSGFLGGLEAAGVSEVEDGLLESLDLGGADERERLRDGQEGGAPARWAPGADQRDDEADRPRAEPHLGGVPQPQRVETPGEPAVGVGALGRTRVDTRDLFEDVQEVGREKLEVFLWFLGQRLEADPNVKVVAWCRFRAEAFRAVAEAARAFPQLATAVILGGQKREDRLRALALLKPETAPPGPVLVVGIEGTGSFGLDMTASHTCVTLSSGYSPGRAAQTLDRVYGPGQKHPIAYYSILATGPKGQRTIDHAIEEARRAGEDVASWTAAAWVKALGEE